MTTMVSVQGDTRMVALTGEIDMRTADQLGDRLCAELDIDGCRRLEVDLAGLRFIDSSGIRNLVRAARHASGLGVEFTVVRPEELVRTVIEVTGVAGYLGLTRD